MTVAQDPRIGTELAGYRFEALLGRGGMSDVYLAQDLRLKRRVALKLLAPDLTGDERFRERFLRESQLAASIDHPNVIPIYEAGEADGLLYIAMRYVEGTDLKRLLASDGKLEPARALNLLAQAAAALDEAHTHGLVHRDVKPANILIGAHEHVYLADFGLTKHTTETGLTETGQFMGTADYVSPEQIERRPVTAQTDVYSLGCVLYECLTGQAPYRSESLMGVLWAHVHTSAPSAHERNPSLPPAIDPVLAKALAKAPEDRHTGCRELVAAAREALGAPAAAPAATVPLLRRKEFLIGVGASAAAAAAAAAGLLLTRGGGRSGGLGLAPANALARIDAGTNEVTHIVPGLPAPHTLAAGEGAVWVLSRDGSAVVRLDAETLATTSHGVPGTPAWIAVGEGSAWVVTSFEGKGYLLSLDPATGVLRQRLPISYPDPRGIVVAGGSVWVFASDSLRGRNALLRFPPDAALAGETLEPTAEVLLTGLPPASSIGSWLAAGERDLWTLAARESPQEYALYRADLETPTEAQAIAGAGYAEALAVGAGGVWFTDVNSPASVFRVDPTNGNVLEERWGTRDIGPLLFAHDSLWIGDLLDGTVTRVDPGSGEAVASIRVSEAQPPEIQAPIYFPAPDFFLVGLAADADGVWALTTKSAALN